MTYSEIIKQNGACISNPWWAECAFHYTDITNAVNIIKTGCLFSRLKAIDYNLMNNDNASQQVIDMTYSDAASYVRFYYRPLTPTQYHNEGYKHPNLRYCHDANANVPVPVFFIFDLEKILNMAETRFSEKSLAGGGEDLQSGPEAFSGLNFNQIYKNGYMEDPDEEKKYRHAEIVYPMRFEITPALKAIACRNDIERKTLWNLLRKEGNKLFSQYHKYICVYDECFEKNGLYISECEYLGTTATIVFSNTSKKQTYINKYRVDGANLGMIGHVNFQWIRKSDILGMQSCDFKIDYEKSCMMTFTGLKRIENATSLHMQVYFENMLACYMCWQLADAAML